MLRAAGEAGEACLRNSIDSLSSSLAALVCLPRRRVLHKKVRSYNFYVQLKTYITANMMSTIRTISRMTATAAIAPIIGPVASDPPSPVALNITKSFN